MRAIPLSLMLAGAVAVGACDRATEPPTTETPATLDGAGAQMGENDDWITTQVEARFYGNQDVPNHIDVSADNGVVTLSGRVPEAQVEQQAIQLARGVEGVRDVRSELTVPDATEASDRSATPAMGTDADRDETGAVESAWITTKIQSRYFIEDDVKGRNIDVTTRNGVVTVSGTVENESQRQLALRIARESDGVRDVRDQLRIAGVPDATADPAAAAQAQPAPRMTDDDLETRVQSRFYQNDDLRAHRIEVDADDGVVTLSGEVENETRRRQALSMARNVEGVRDVRDEMSIDAEMGRPAAGTPTARDENDRDMGDRFDDGWITTKVQAQYYLDTDLKGRNIDVTTLEGVVTLTGEVESERHRQLAIETARDTDGVKNVVDRLQIVTSIDR